MNISTDTINDVKQCVQQANIIRLDELLYAIGDADAVYWAIATNQVYVNLHHDLLCRPNATNVYADEIHAEAHANSQRHLPGDLVGIMQAAVGDTVQWNDEPWLILSDSGGNYTLRHETKPIVTLRHEEFISLFQEGNITGDLKLSEREQDQMDKIRKASSEYLTLVNQRWQCLQLHRQGMSVPKDFVSNRTLREWDRLVREAEAAGRNGYFALFLNESSRGNRLPRLSKPEVDLINTSITKDYRNEGAPRKSTAYAAYKIRCEDAGIEPVSHVTYSNYINKQDAKAVTTDREGESQAYRELGPESRQQEKDFSYPVHGDRPFEVAHEDHTELDIEVISPWTGEVLGRPWLSVLIDAYTRLVLAFWLSFESPSHRSLMMLIRRCVQRFNRIPMKNVVDHGAEFESVYFESLLMARGSAKVERKAKKPRDGSIIERNIGTINTQVLYGLKGNTQATKHGRAMSASHDPKKHAIWTPDQLHVLLEEYLFDVYPQQPHHGIHEHPANRMEREMKIMGMREHACIRYDDSFHIQTMPPVSGETRIVRNNAVKVDHILYRGSALSRHSGESIPVRSDPFDMRYVYAFVDGQWQKLYTTSDLVRECHEREIMSAHIEILGRARKTGREYRNVNKRLLQFLRDVKSKEKRLLDEKLAKQNPVSDTNAEPNQTQDDTNPPSSADIPSAPLRMPKQLPVTRLQGT